MLAFDHRGQDSLFSAAIGQSESIPNPGSTDRRGDFEGRNPMRTVDDPSKGGQSLPWADLQQYDRELRVKEEAIDRLEGELKRLRAEHWVDPRTGLHTPAFFHSRLKEEVLRSERYRHFVSIVLLHVDSGPESTTRRLEDAFRVFAEEARAGAIRRTDICAVFRRRQIAIVLPEVDRAGAESAAQRHRALLPSPQHKLYHGVVCYPRDASTPERLLERLGEVSDVLARDTERRIDAGTQPIT
jgi:GGDEF domain-containing protein